ncbi:ccr4-not complex component [Moniliophthora roreri]|nr:ccr4-not complex component [Moniliophthora roreri]
MHMGRNKVIPRTRQFAFASGPSIVALSNSTPTVFATFCPRMEKVADLPFDLIMLPTIIEKIEC